jgi:hypothetical protein
MQVQLQLKVVVESDRVDNKVIFCTVSVVRSPGYIDCTLTDLICIREK